VDNGADIKKQDENGDTCLHKAIKQKSSGDLVEFLKSKWGSFDIPLNNEGKSPAMLLAEI